MKTLSFTNIRKLIRYYWQTEKHTYLRLYLGLTGLYLIKYLLHYIMNQVFQSGEIEMLRYIFNDEWIFWGFILICTARMFYVLENKQTATTFLSLPASNMEKYLTRVVYATIGIYLLALAARLTANTIDSIPLLFDSNGKDFGYILRYEILPGSWIISSIQFVGAQTIFDIIRVVTWAIFFALWPWSLFTLSGLLFRRHGWLWAIPILFIGVSFFGLCLYTMIHNNWNKEQHLYYFTIMMLTVLIPTIFNYWFAYRCFCKAQVVSNKITRL